VRSLLRLSHLYGSGTSAGFTLRLRHPPEQLIDKLLLHLPGLDLRPGDLDLAGEYKRSESAESTFLVVRPDRSDAESLAVHAKLLGRELAPVVRAHFQRTMDSTLSVFVGILKSKDDPKHHPLRLFSKVGNEFPE